MIADLTVPLLFVIVFALATLAVNAIWKRVLGQSSGFGYWAINLLTFPGLSAMFGMYSIWTFEECRGGTHMCSSPEWERFAIGTVFFMFIPLFSLCVSIPVTTWFASRKSAK